MFNFDQEQKITANVTPVEIFEYDNGSVVFLNPELAAWVRTSSTGLWIYKYLKQNPSTFSEAVRAVASHYGLPTDVVSESTLQFLEDMTFYEFLTSEGSEQKSVTSISKLVELSELGLQELCLDVTSLCHGACQHCYKPRNDTYHFPVRDLEELLVQAKTLGVANLTISGGEPLLHPEFCRIMRLARRVSDWTITVLTAGQSSDSQVVDALMENADIVRFSLDGTDKDTNDSIRGEGAFESALTLLKLLHEHKNRDRKKIGISFTPLPDNINQMQDLGKLGYTLGIDFIHFNRLKHPANLGRDMFNYSRLNSQDLFKKALENYDRLVAKMWDASRELISRGGKLVSLDASFIHCYDLFNVVKKSNCGAGITTLAITEKGDSYPCAALQRPPETHLGNWIRERDLAGLYTRARNWNQSIFSVDVCEQCQACHFRYLCGGGCRARANSLAGADSSCEVMLEGYSEFFRLGQVLVRKFGHELIGNISDTKAEVTDEQQKSRVKLKRCI